MKSLILINSLDMTEYEFNNAIKAKKQEIQKCTEVYICDLTTDILSKKIGNWLRKIKKLGIIEVIDVYDSNDFYDLIIQIGDYYNLPNFTNYVILVKYKMKITKEM